MRRAGLATAAALVIGGSGVAIGAAATDSGATGIAAAAKPTPGPVPPGSYAGPNPATGYAGVVRQVLPSVVLIRTADGLGSGVVLDASGNIVTNAHVAGNAREFQVQVAGDTAPRPATLVGTYPPHDLAVIRADDPSGLRRAARRAAARRRASASPSRPTWPATSRRRSSSPGTSPTRTGPPSAPRSRPSSGRTARRAAPAWSPSPVVVRPNGRGFAPAT